MQLARSVAEVRMPRASSLGARQQVLRANVQPALKVGVGRPGQDGGGELEQDSIKGGGMCVVGLRRWNGLVRDRVMQTGQGRAGIGEVSRGWGTMSIMAGRANQLGNTARWRAWGEANDVRSRSPSNSKTRREGTILAVLGLAAGEWRTESARYCLYCGLEQLCR